MAKRKRESAPDGDAIAKASAAKKVKAPAKAPAKAQPKPAPLTSTVFKVGENTPITIQIVAGSYDRVLHGITASIKSTPASVPETTEKKKSKKTKGDSAPIPTEKAEFADTFLFNAHNSAIRCLALSPPSAPSARQTQKVLLATGSTDERINIYNLSAHPPSVRSADDQKLLSSLAPRPILENSNNRELGTLLHHTSNITRLSFPNRSKLLSASEDSTVAVTRTRDWAMLHSFKAPIPKVMGRPSGDTAAVGGTPSGVNDFAVHPSNKIMITVSKGERCMRLWNLETGKKSRVLNFERPMLSEAGEGRHGTGEARRIVWGSSKGGEDEFALAFDRDVVVFGMDCRPRCRVMDDIKTKVHEIQYVALGGEEEGALLAVSTEDGRVLFFDTSEEGMEKAPENKTLGIAKLVAQLGGKEAGVSGRVKDFSVLPVEDEQGKRSWYVVTAGSDGSIRLWKLESSDLKDTAEADKKQQAVGKLLGTYGTQNRITCLEAFVMIPKPDGAEDSEYEFGDSESSDDDSDDE